MEDFQNIMKVGEGTYGNIYSARHKITQELRAIKKVYSRNDRGVSSTTIREISFLMSIQHPNIVKMFDVRVDTEVTYMYLELLPKDLQTEIESLGSRKFMAPAKVKSYLLQINNAILFCHQRHILHRDLKPPNLLVDDKRGIIKVADFGFARIDVPGNMYSPKVGTLWYSSPELLLGTRRYSCPVDIWSMGCVFAEMCTKVPLFPGESELDQLFTIFKYATAFFRVLRTPTEEIWPGVSQYPCYSEAFPNWTTYKLHEHVRNLDEDGMDLLQKMIVYDPVQRITAKASSKHKYFTGVMLPPELSTPST